MNAALARRARTAARWPSASASSFSSRTRSIPVEPPDAPLATGRAMSASISADDDRQAGPGSAGGRIALGRSSWRTMRPGPGQATDRGPQPLERRRQAGGTTRSTSRATPPAAIPASARALRMARTRSDHGADLVLERRRPGSRPPASRPRSADPGRPGACGMRRPDRLGHERHDRVEQAQVAVEGIDQRPPRRGPLLGRTPRDRCEPDLGELDPPVAELGPDPVVQGPGDLAELVLGDRAVDALGRRARPGTGSSARPGPRSASAGAPRGGIAARSPAGRAPRTNRAAFQSLFAKFRASSSFCGPNRWSWPAVAPWIRAKRSASAPASSMTASGSTTLPFVFDIFCPCGSPDQARQGDGVERLDARSARSRASSSGRPRRR